ncbi:MAG: hypothetical protein JWQ41_2164 [Variovorax sp.]|nr:hypothetical protein [Variovorax sp.]
MNSQSPTPSTRSTAGIRCMTERQTDAYLMARDIVRRVQRSTSLLVGALPPPTASGRNRGRGQGGRQTSH